MIIISKGEGQERQDRRLALAGGRPLYDWASVKGGKWHSTTAPAQNFSTPVKARCGLEFVPYNVKEPMHRPDGLVKGAVCEHCLKVSP